MPRPVNRNLLDPITDRDINPRPYLGYMFETAQHHLDSVILNAIRQRCSAFLLQLLKELQQRLPDNYKQLESMELLRPEEAIKPIKSNTIIDVAEISGFTPEIIDKTKLDNAEIQKQVKSEAGPSSYKLLHQQDDILPDVTIEKNQPETEKRNICSRRIVDIKYFFQNCK
ncbi:unnamed protein product [Parnassius apollo]|uniref:(apollo) hypothetical protein n=1 Tax=Parnassius apollo TaxID=110799 RepID=A0A8S3XG06_PARAO|nr:unnamed protein product [Parnassius apollo]